MTHQHRVLVCITLGAVLVLAATVVNALLASGPDGGWFMYSPNSAPLFSAASSDSETLRSAAVWLAAIALWFVLSWRLFRANSD